MGSRTCLAIHVHPGLSDTKSFDCFSPVSSIIFRALMPSTLTTVKGHCSLHKEINLFEKNSLHCQLLLMMGCILIWPAIIRCFGALSLVMRPIAPPSPFTQALFCLWTWSSAIEENFFPVLFMTNLPSAIALFTSGLTWFRLVMSA